MLGLSLCSICLFQRGDDALAAVAFMLSLGFKQMALYYAPAVFAYCLGKCIHLGVQQGYVTLPLYLKLSVCANPKTGRASFFDLL